MVVVVVDHVKSLIVLEPPSEIRQLQLCVDLRQLADLKGSIVQIGNLLIVGSPFSGFVRVYKAVICDFGNLKNATVATVVTVVTIVTVVIVATLTCFTVRFRLVSIICNLKECRLAGPAVSIQQPSAIIIIKRLKRFN